LQLVAKPTQQFELAATRTLVRQVTQRADPRPVLQSRSAQAKSVQLKPAPAA